MTAEVVSGRVDDVVPMAVAPAPLVPAVTDQVREADQKTLDALLVQRRGG